MGQPLLASHLASGSFALEENYAVNGRLEIRLISKKKKVDVLMYSNFKKVQSQMVDTISFYDSVIVVVT